MDTEPLYTHIDEIIFESPREKEEIYRRCLQATKTDEAMALGKRFVNARMPEIEVRFLGDLVGHGAFLTEDLPQEGFVGEYVGTVRRNDIRRYSLNNYLYTYPIEDINGINYVIDATIGSKTRFINHSFSPNLKPFYAFWGNFFHVIFLTTRPIKKGEQLLFDYGESYWYLRKWPQEL